MGINTSANKFEVRLSNLKPACGLPEAASGQPTSMHESRVRVDEVEPLAVP